MTDGLKMKKEKETKLNKDNNNQELTISEKVFGFKIEYLKSWHALTALLFKPVDPSSLAVSRILFGVLMFLDIPDERGFGIADLRWGNPDECRFPLFDILSPLPLEWMCVIYFIMWLGAFGIMTGAFYRQSCIAFVIPYWYLFLLDKTSWNNHSYLYGLVGILLMFTDAHNCWSIDALLGKVKGNSDVPLWNYGILRFQFFLLYFYAGLKKIDYDWLSGHSMSQLSAHWVFDPFRPFLDAQEIDLYIVHITGFLLDLTMGFFIYFEKTRPVAFLFLSSFHLMNSQMFQIGMFPYVCLVTMPLFCKFDWPKRLLVKVKPFQGLVNCSTEKNPNCCYDFQFKNGEEKNTKKTSPPFKRKLTAILLGLHVIAQMFIPYSHFITKGYNNWTNGLYGYSWDMMVHSWEPVLVIVKVVNKDTGEEIFLDPQAWVSTDRWHKHGDMVIQYSKCVQRNILKSSNLKNFSLHLDVWTSLNRRFQQRMFDPRVDLLTAEWSPVKPVSWLMPLLTDLSDWRHQMRRIEKEVHSWSNYSNVIFFADFPGLYLENYIHKDLKNVSLTVLEGEVAFESSNSSHLMNKGASHSVSPGIFHKVHVRSDVPACYMYTFYNMTKNIDPPQHKKLTFDQMTKYIQHRIDNIITSIALISNAFLKIFYSVPMLRRVRVPN